jgi:hypothetical protein
MGNKKKLVCGCKVHVLECLYCRKPTCLLELSRNNDLYCDACWWLVGKRLKHSTECLIPGCKNRTDQGEFEGDLCRPCHNYVVKGAGVHSQAYRNELVKANFRFLAAMKPLGREAVGSQIHVITPQLAYALMRMSAYGKLGR